MHCALRHATLGMGVLLAAAGAALPCHGQVLTYPDPSLDSIYPAGGQPGQTIEVELGGNGGLMGAKEILVDGPPGVTATVKAADYYKVTATLTIAPDARLGRRLLRVAGAANGLTNCRPFFVGTLPEPIEAEPNDTAEAPQDVTVPAVINGRLQAALDVDHYRFQGRTGQSIVAAVLAHGMDSVVRQSFVVGYLDASVELLDASGGVLAAAEDTVGLDPVLNYVLPADGQYTVRVRALAYAGATTAVYRLTLGEVPYPTALFPPGGRRGETVEVELFGPNVPPGTRQSVTVPADDRDMYQRVALDVSGAPPQELLFLRGDLAELIETEPNDKAEEANAVASPVTVNGRFHEPGESDWYRLHLAQGQAVIASTLAQRHLRAAVDTAIEVYDAAGKKLAENDDGSLFMGQVWHDYESADSWLSFTAPAEGDYFLRARDQSGAAGPQAVYRLTLEPYGPDFTLFQWPDAVPVWGAGTTTAFVTQVFTRGGLASDVEVTVEGLPEGWQGSTAWTPASYHGVYRDTYIGTQPLLTITAPPDAAEGTIVPFRVVGRATHEGRTIEHEAQYLTLYGNAHNDRMFLRYGAAARAVVAGPMDCQVEALVTELTVPHGGTVEIPVRVHRRPDAPAEIGLGVDGISVYAGSGWRPPMTLAPGQSDVLVPLTVSPEWRAGVYPIMVSRSWNADLRAGRPGPCTPVIKLTIQPPAGQ
jgi:hypothetical protein